MTHQLSWQLQAYISVKDVIARLVDDILEQEGETQGNRGEGWHIYVTGHSLGGALATLCANELAVSHPPIILTCTSVPYHVYPLTHIIDPLFALCCFLITSHPESCLKGSCLKAGCTFCLGKFLEQMCTPMRGPLEGSECTEVAGERLQAVSKTGDHHVFLWPAQSGQWTLCQAVW